MNMLKFTPSAGVLLCTGILTLSFTGHAQSLLNVKIGLTTQDSASDGAYQESAAAVLGAANAYWNEYAYATNSPNLASVVDSSGAALSGVTLTVSHTGGVGVFNTPGNPDYLMGNMVYQNPGESYNISLEGLPANTQFEFVGYAAFPTLSLGASWAVTTGTLILGANSNDGSSDDIAAAVGKAYSRFLVMTDGSGKLTVTDVSNNGSFPIIQGFQLMTVVVPEPGTWAMMAGGCGMFLVARRCRGKQAS